MSHLPIKRMGDLSEESQHRREQILDLLRDADHAVVIGDLRSTLESIEYARNVVMAEMVSEERDEMRREMAASDLARLRARGF